MKVYKMEGKRENRKGRTEMRTIMEVKRRLLLGVLGFQELTIAAVSSNTALSSSAFLVHYRNIIVDIVYCLRYISYT
jgi:hypothetical protein